MGRRTANRRTKTSGGVEVRADVYMGSMDLISCIELMLCKDWQCWLQYSYFKIACALGVLHILNPEKEVD